MSAPKYSQMESTPEVHTGDPQVVFQQPGPSSNSTTVIVQQPAGPRVVLPRNWNSGVCDCCDDVKICMCGTFCHWCLACQVAGDMNESMLLPCCVSNFLTTLRVKMRSQENIQGSILDDSFSACFCGPCVLCQLAREVQYLRSRPYIA